MAACHHDSVSVSRFIVGVWETLKTGARPASVLNVLA